MSAIRLSTLIAIVGYWLLAGCRITASLVEFTPKCLDALTAEATRIGGNWELNAQWGAQLGLETQGSTPYRFKALHAPATDGLRFFGVGSTEWTRGLLIHPAESGSEIFAIDRAGRLVSAGRETNGNFEIISIDVPAVREAFQTEVSNWLAAARVTPATSEACR